MEHDDLHMFLSIAEIAGVFVGFGALISASGEQTMAARGKLLTTSMIGIVVLIASLLPVWLARFGVTGRTLWEFASGIFLMLIWASILIGFRDPEFRQWSKKDAKDNVYRSAFFWVFLEVPIQLSLVLVILGVAPTLAPAFYTTALVLNLFEAAMTLARYVLAKDTHPSS